MPNCSMNADYLCGVATQEVSALQGVTLDSCNVQCCVGNNCNHMAQQSSVSTEQTTAMTTTPTVSGVEHVMQPQLVGFVMMFVTLILNSIDESLWSLFVRNIHIKAFSFTWESYFVVVLTLWIRSVWHNLKTFCQYPNCPIIAAVLILHLLRETLPVTYLSADQSTDVVVNWGNRSWRAFLKRPENFTGPKSQLTNWNPLVLKSWSFNVFLMKEKLRGLRSLMA